MKDFRKLNVWEKGHLLALEVYNATRSFPKDELYGLTSQMRRASVSIPSNIAEGCGRGSDAELSRFCQISMGSASELEYQILLSRDLGYLEDPLYEKLTNMVIEVKRMLTSFIQKIRVNN
ncbi:MAG: four helix bundle protein [bacterium]|nr:four helix bundle protein [bacterium]